ncbi:hypothetical protein OPIT5_00430 (plasmid) [Opitutaceae bacterium TAV5]|nr:hypothetical protein OPIT5_00430 [Opitutaceae bacterium TAV5]
MVAKPPTDPAPGRETSGPERKKKPPASIRTSLLNLAAADSTADSQLPFSLTLNKTPSVSIGFFTDTGKEIIMPYIHFSAGVRMGEEMALACGKYEITVRFDAAKASEHKWQIQQVVDALHSQTLTWLRHDPETGLTVHAAPLADGEEG